MTYNGMPKIQSAFLGWMQDIVLVTKTQEVNNAGFIDESTKEKKFRGTVQPLNPESILLKPEGQRSFKWLQIHVPTGSLLLSTNDLIKVDSKIYKIMDVLDYNSNNFKEYHAIEDFQG